MQSLLYIGVGGFLGANARYIISGWFADWLTKQFGWTVPVGTIFVNVTGSIFLGMFVAWSSNHITAPQHVRLLIATGFIGAYTTFATYSIESVTLWNDRWLFALGNIVGTNLLCLTGAAIGLIIGTRLWAIT